MRRGYKMISFGQYLSIRQKAIYTETCWKFDSVICVLKLRNHQKMNERFAKSVEFMACFKEKLCSNSSYMYMYS